MGGGEGGLTTALGGGGGWHKASVSGGGGTRGGYNLGGWVQTGAAPSPPLVTKKVMIFGHKKSGLKPAVLGSPQPIHVPPPPQVSNERLCPQKIRSERKCSLDTPFGARDNIAKRR